MYDHHWWAPYGQNEIISEKIELDAKQAKEASDFDEEYLDSSEQYLIEK